MLSTYQLRQKAQKFANEYWGLEFNLPIVINSRLTRALGKFWHGCSYGNPIKIELATRLLENYDEETIDGVLKHELCHWALYMQQKPFDDGHPLFESEIKRIGSHSTNTIKAVVVHVGLCSKCGTVTVERNTEGKVRRFCETSRYWSRCCGARITYGGSYSPLNGETFSAANKVQATVEEKKTPIATPVSNDELIEIGPRGVTNKQMIPAIRKAIDEGSKEKLEKLRNTYPDVFEASLRYIGKNYHRRIYTLIPFRF